MSERVGILLAAGRGRRMGQTKQLLPWPPGSEGCGCIVTAAYDTLADVCDRMVVVLGHDRDAVADALRPRDFTTALSDPDQPMFASLVAGFAAAGHLSPDAIVLVHPADHPEVGRPTLDLLLETVTRDPERAAMPEYDGRGGHPVLIPVELIARIRSHAAEGGLRQFWIDHPEIRRRVPVDDPSVVRDIDTPDHYRH